MAQREAFGTTGLKEVVERLTITGGGLTARFLTWGAVLQDLRLEGHPAPLVLGFTQLDHYIDHSRYFGAIVGRYANRIARGKFVIDGERFETDTNDNGNTLHGGAEGLDRRLWRVAEVGPDFVTLAIVDPAGTMGFPGSVDIACTFRLKSRATLAIEMVATTDRPTLVNLAHHSYFNLDDGGRSTSVDHRISIAASAYTPVDAHNIPTGEVLPVAGTAFDFLLPRMIGGVAIGATTTISALRRAVVPLRRAAWVQGGTSGVEMETWTTEPGLQFYTGQFPDLPVPGLDGIVYQSCAGFCLEPQIWPDSPNRPYFPQAVLRPGETYRQLSEYRFRLPDDA